MLNPFFKLALARAARIAGKPGRLLKLIAQLTTKLYTTDRQQLVLSVRTQLNTASRLVAAYARGHYRMIPLAPLLSLIAAIIYFINPLDLIPDAIIGVGFADDLAVLTWVYRTSQLELDKFLEWEKTRS
jgi:uncharacterized membrane protein YkvA (DUF1232 family)